VVGVDVVLGLCLVWWCGWGVVGVVCGGVVWGVWGGGILALTVLQSTT